MALAFVFVPIAGVLFFGEKLDARYMMGAALIMTGVLLASRA
jgi:drug/metabolite transporter (DMT)-like permease